MATAEFHTQYLIIGYAWSVLGILWLTVLGLFGQWPVAATSPSIIFLGCAAVGLWAYCDRAVSRVIAEIGVNDMQQRAEPYKSKRQVSLRWVQYVAYGAGILAFAALWSAASAGGA